MRADASGISVAPGESDIAWGANEYETGRNWEVFLARLQNLNEQTWDDDEKKDKGPPPNRNAILGELKMNLVSSGTWNRVWRTTNQSVDLLFPPLIRNIRNDVVFRIPKPLKDTMRTINAEVQAREIHNVIEAASSGFGAPLHAAIVVSDTTAGASGSAMHRNDRLITISERLHRPVIDIIKSAAWMDVPTFEPEMTHFIQLLRDVVFEYSVRRVIHLDATLSNFMVHVTKPAPDGRYGDNLQYIKNTIRQTDAIYAIDLDPIFYRRIEPLPKTDGENYGWRCIWLFNILFVSMHLKAYSSADIMRLWLEGSTSNTKTLRSTIDELVQHEVGKQQARVQGNVFNDVSNQCSWIVRTAWVGKIEHPQIARTPSMEALSKNMVQQVYYYFVAETLRNVRKEIAKMINRQNPAEQANAQRWYNQIYIQYQFPIMRFLRERQLAGDTLITVMHKAVTLSNAELLAITPKEHIPVRIYNLAGLPSALPDDTMRYLEGTRGLPL